MLKKTLVFFLIQHLLITTFMIPVHADDSAVPSSEETYSHVFQMTDERQVYTFTDHSGLQTTLSVESTSVDGEKLISYSSSQLSASFKIYIASGIIVSAYQGSYSTNSYAITSTDLSVNSYYKATYTLYYTYHSHNYSFWLRASIVNNSLEITHN